MNGKQALATGETHRRNPGSSRTQVTRVFTLDQRRVKPGQNTLWMRIPRAALAAAML